MIKENIRKAKKSAENHMNYEASCARECLFQHTSSRLKWPKTDGEAVPGSHIDRRIKDNKTKYGSIKPENFTRQKDIYNLFLAQLVAPTNPFRSKIEANLVEAVDWKKIDKLELFIDSKLLSFIWKSTHGLIYSNKEYERFHIKNSNK